MMTSQILRNDFAVGLRKTRDAKGLSQEDFGLVSSRTYISSLERGLKNPTLNKVDDLANTLGVHPLSLLVMSYLPQSSGAGPKELIDQIQAEVASIIKTRIPNS
jgi:transcriptional regulator with XRE-family HTH domain